MIDFSGQTAIVTGAGRGIGRETALALARRGARILVNDYGGDGSSMSPGSIEVAQAVVEEIQAAGGEAHASAASVGSGESADEIVGDAMKEFGRLDILVNNAGGSFGIVGIDQGSDADAEGVLRSNLVGPYMLIRRAWPIMRRQGHGRIVNMMSGAMMGMAGTSSYSAAKSGLIGLTNTIAIEGTGHGIRVNGVWPVAFTRLAGKLEDEATFEWMKRFPAHLVAEGIVYLCSRECSVSGEMFTIGGGHIARNAVFGGVGFLDPGLTAESVALSISSVCDMEGAALITSTQDETARLG